jgi:hypothetical protein
MARAAMLERRRLELMEADVNPGTEEAEDRPEHRTARAIVPAWRGRSTGAGVGRARP